MKNLNSNNELRKTSDQIKPQENDYTIYQYFIKRPTLLIAVTSGIIAILTFLVNSLIYIKNIQLLQYWNVDSTLVLISSQKLSYIVIFSIIYSLILFAATSWISNTFSAYMNYHISLSIIKKSLANSKKVNKKVKRENAQISKEKSSDSQVQAIDKDIETTNVIEHYRKITNRFYNRKIALNLAIAMMFLIASSIFIVYSDIVTQPLSNPIYKIIMFSIIQFLAYCLLYYVLMRITAFIKISKQKITLYNFESYIKYDDLPLTKIKKNGLKALFTNSTIYLYLSSLVMLMCLALVFFSIPSNNTFENQAQYKVFEISDKYYLGVYSDQNKVILEEAKIDDKTAFVYTTKQRIISSDSCQFEMVTFDKVVRVKEQ